MAKSPIKFGLGEYSDEPFELKSGNQPAFKNMGSSNSPLDHPHKEPKAHGDTGHNTDTGKSVAQGGNPKPGHPDYKGKNSPVSEQEEGKGQGWKKALTIVGEMALGGLDAVYGTGKVVSMSDRLTKKGNKKVCKDKDGNVVSCDSPNAVDPNDASESVDKIV